MVVMAIKIRYFQQSLKKKKAEKLKGIARPQEVRNKISESHKGKTHSEETKMKMTTFRAREGKRELE